MNGDVADGIGFWGDTFYVLLKLSCIFVRLGGIEFWWSGKKFSDGIAIDFIRDWVGL